jgi:hypothetical protein
MSTLALDIYWSLQFVKFPPYLADITTCRQNSKTEKNISSWELSKKIALAFPSKMFFAVIAPGIQQST